MEQIWDAIIIGGGPAGSSVARYAAKGGAKVLVIDSRKTIGTPLQCGELVPTNDELGKLCPDVPDIDELFTIPEKAISKRTNTMGLVTPSGKKLIYPFQGKILERPIHDLALVDLAKKEGAEYLTKAKVTNVKKEQVTLSNGDIVKGKIIVGCGGPHDPVRGKYWDEESLNIFVKFMLIEGEFEDRVDLYFGSTAPGGYAWVIPKKGGANIGIGIQKKYAKGKNLKSKSDEFFSKFEGKITYQGSGALPMSGTISTLSKGNYMLVGDAAGMVLPSNGAGITIAMIGGRIAGQVISEHLSNGIPLEEYEKRWKKQMGKVMRNSKRSFKMGSMLFRLPDWILNLLFNRLTKNIIWRAVTCRRMLWVL